MRKTLIKSAIAMSVLVAFAACSTSKKDEQSTDTQKPLTADEKALAEEYAALPGVVIEVPKDENGNLKNTEAKMALYSGTAEAVSDDSSEVIWTESAAAKTVTSTDELDQDSSTQSWHDPRPGYNQNNDFNQNGNQVDGDFTAININDVNNSNINVDVNSNNYYGSYYPRAYSLRHSSSFWSYCRRPIQRCHVSSCRFFYPRPTCNWNWCGYARQRSCGLMRNCGNTWYDVNSWGSYGQQGYGYQGYDQQGYGQQGYGY